MAKTTTKSSKAEVKNKKDHKSGKPVPSTPIKKGVKVVLKKAADKVEKKGDKHGDKKGGAKHSVPVKPSTSLKINKGRPLPKDHHDKTATKGKVTEPVKVSAADAQKSKVKVGAPPPKLKQGEKREVEAHRPVDMKTGEKAPVKKAATDKETAEKLSSEKASNLAKTPPKKKTGEKKDEFSLEDDLVGESDDFTSDELSEYQAELENAEEEIDEKEVVVEEVSVSSTSTITSTLVSKDKGGDIVLTDAEGRRYCRVKDCDQVETVDGYCRYHYLLLWKRIQIRKKILTDGKLERYVEELTSRYPDKFLEVIRRDLRSEKDFIAAIQEMEIDESSSDNDFEDESSNFIDEVRGASSEALVEEDDY